MRVNWEKVEKLSSSISFCKVHALRQQISALEISNSRILKLLNEKERYNLDRKQSLGQRWVMVGVVVNTSLLTCWLGPTLVQLLCFNSWSSLVGSTLALQLRTNGGFWVVGRMLNRHMLADCNRVLFLNIKFS